MAMELIYTSAPRGLRPGTSGYCTVAHTQGMPPTFVSTLEQLSAYRHIFKAPDPRAKDNPVAYMHVTMRLGGQKHHILSRICDLGLDYSHRTNLLAHHIVLTPAEAALCEGGPAWLASQPGTFRDRWDGSPQHLLPRVLPRTAPVFPEPGLWERYAGDAAWAEEFLRTSSTDAAHGLIAYLVFEPGTDVLPLFLEAQSLLDARARWACTFSTYFWRLPSGTECQWRAVPAGQPEAEQLKKRPGRDIILDLTQPQRPRPFPAPIVRPPVANVPNLDTGDDHTAGPDLIPPSREERLPEIPPPGPHVEDAALPPLLPPSTSPPQYVPDFDPLSASSPGAIAVNNTVAQRSVSKTNWHFLFYPAAIIISFLLGVMLRPWIAGLTDTLAGTYGYVNRSKESPTPQDIGPKDTSVVDDLFARQTDNSNEASPNDTLHTESTIDAVRGAGSPEAASQSDTPNHPNGPNTVQTHDASPNDTTETQPSPETATGPASPDTVVQGDSSIVNCQTQYVNDTKQYLFHDPEDAPTTVKVIFPPDFLTHAEVTQSQNTNKWNVRSKHPGLLADRVDKPLSYSSLMEAYRKRPDSSAVPISRFFVLEIEYTTTSPSRKCYVIALDKKAPLTSKHLRDLSKMFREMSFEGTYVLGTDGSKKQSWQSPKMVINGNGCNKIQTNICYDAKHLVGATQQIDTYTREYVDKHTRMIKEHNGQYQAWFNANGSRVFGNFGDDVLSLVAESEPYQKLREYESKHYCCVLERAEREGVAAFAEKYQCTWESQESGGKWKKLEIEELLEYVKDLNNKIRNSFFEAWNKTCKSRDNLGVLSEVTVVTGPVPIKKDDWKQQIMERLRVHVEIVTIVGTFADSSKHTIRLDVLLAE